MYLASPFAVSTLISIAIYMKTTFKSEYASIGLRSQFWYYCNMFTCYDLFLETGCSGGTTSLWRPTQGNVSRYMSHVIHSWNRGIFQISADRNRCLAGTSRVTHLTACFTCIHQTWYFGKRFANKVPDACCWNIMSGGYFWNMLSGW